MDEILFEKAKKGDEYAFEQLIKPYQSQIYNIAYRITNNREDAFDVSQETLIKIYNNLDSFEKKSKLSTWIFRIATNSAIDYSKKHKKHNNLSLDDEEDGFMYTVPSKELSPHQQLLQKERQKAVIEALENLSADMKAVVVLRDINGFSYQEIAEIMLCSEGTVKSRINRARQKMQKILLKNNSIFE